MAAVQHQDHALLFLCSHDLEEAEHYGLDTSFLVAPLQTGAVSLTSASDGDSLNTDAEALVTILGKQITLTYNSTSANPGTFTGKYTRVTCMFQFLSQQSTPKNNTVGSPTARHHQQERIFLLAWVSPRHRKEHVLGSAVSRRHRGREIRTTYHRVLDQ